MRTFMEGAALVLRESLILVYVIGATLGFSFLYLFVFIQQVLCGEEISK